MGGTRHTTRRAIPAALAVLVALALAFGSSAAASEPAATWAITPSPNRTGSSNENSVSCVTADDCVAVGFYGATSPDRTLAMTWDGSSWSGSPTHNVGTGTNWLMSVSCVTSTFCMAVGFDAGTPKRGGSLPLVETFDGSRWSRGASLHLGHTNNGSLSSVSCVDETDCTAVGQVWNPTANTHAALIEHWNGADWQTVPSPTLTPYTNLASVSCASATMCVAVGTHFDTVSSTLIEMWDGTSWTVAPSADPGSSNALNSVSCPTTTTCVAVGQDYGPHGTEPTLIEVWDGATWTFETSVTQGDGINWLNGVSCADATDCVAVGGYSLVAGKSDYRSLLLSWQGTDWAVMTAPEKGRLDNLASVSCPGPTTCRALGEWQRHNQINRTLVLTESPTPTPTQP